MNNFLVAPKDMDTITQKIGVILSEIKCNRVVFDDKFIGESARTFGDRFKGHFKDPSPIYEHCNITRQHTSVDDFSIMVSEVTESY